MTDNTFATKQELLMLLDQDYTQTNLQLARQLRTTPETVDAMLRQLEAEKILIPRQPIINWEKAGLDYVSALIEVKITPQREVGFDAIAGRLKLKAHVAVRVNPDVEAHTHAKITTGTYENKFGIAFEDIEAVYKRASRLKNLNLRGLQMHIGSQITDSEPFETAVRKVAPLAARLKARHGIEFLSIGGGIGIVYDPALESGSPAWWQTGPGKKTLTPASYAARLLPELKALGLRILLEPGRYISGNSGILVTRIEYVKRTGRKNFLIVDAAMNDLIRPAFYDAYHQILPLTKKAGALLSSDVVGPICESGDYFCHDRPLPKVGSGDCLALMSAGAYGSVMGSNYNSRSLPAEVLVNGSKAALVRRRQDVADIWANEATAPWQK